MQFSLRSMMVALFVLALALSQWFSSGRFWVELVWLLLPALLVTFAWQRVGEQRTAAASALATYAAIQLSRPNWLTPLWALVLVGIAWWISLYCQRKS